MKQLDELTRARLKRELACHSRPSTEQYRRITGLQRAVIDQYGRRGAEFLMAQQGLVSVVDDSCPWQLDGLTPAAAVDQVFGPLRALLPAFVELLRQRVRWVVPARRDGAWVLVYVTDRSLRDGQPYFQLIVAGAPNPDPQLSPRASHAGWCVPQSLTLLCTVHDGICASQYGILPARRMADLGEIMDGIEEEPAPGQHACTDLLEFHPDGVGNCQAFFRRGADDADPVTVFWDHESNVLSNELPFFVYADQALAREVRDEQ